MSTPEQFEQWCWDRTENDPRVIEFRAVLAALPETTEPLVPYLSAPKFINGKPVKAQQPPDGWDGETI